MVRLTIKVKPGASKDEISIDGNNNISLRIKAKPIDGEANEYLVNYLAEILNISRSRITIEKGATSRIKRIALNIEQTELDKLLRAYKV